MIEVMKEEDPKSFLEVIHFTKIANFEVIFTFFFLHFWTYNKTKTKTYIRILRDTSLRMGLANMYRKSQAYKWYFSDLC